MRLIGNTKIKILLLMFLTLILYSVMHYIVNAHYITYVVEPIYNEEPSYENFKKSSKYNSKIKVSDNLGIEIIDGEVYTKYDVIVTEDYGDNLPDSIIMYVHGAKISGANVIDYLNKIGKDLAQLNTEKISNKIIKIKSRNEEKLKVGKEYEVTLNDLKEGSYIVPGYGYGVKNNSLDDFIKEKLFKKHHV